MFQYKEQPWRTSRLLKRPDNFMASEFTYDQTSRCFVDKGEVNMFDLLSMEYARIWHRQVEEARLQIVLRPEDNDYLFRRYVIRGLASRKAEKPKQTFRMKKFENVPPRIDTNIRQLKFKNLAKGMSEGEKKKVFEEARSEVVRKQRGKGM